MSKVDISGSFLENSTAFDYLWFNSLESYDDFEQNRRYYHSRDLFTDVRPHRFAFRVWLQSMGLRYFIEMAFYAALVALFQYYITNFNKDMY